MRRTLQVGARVRSNYRAPWQGSVVYVPSGPCLVAQAHGETWRSVFVEVTPNGVQSYGTELPAYVVGKGYVPADPRGKLHHVPFGCVVVLADTDRHGLPMRDPHHVVLSEDWLSTVG